MSRTNCPFCGFISAPGLTHCPHCTQPLEADDPALQPPLWRLLAAGLIDVVLVLIPCVLYLGAETWLVAPLPEHPSDHLEALAMWLHMHRGTAVRTATLLLLLILAYGAYSARRGYTAGRWLFGLVLRRTSGDPLSWPLSIWRATMAALSLALCGAGYFWALIDPRHRTFHDILSASVVRRAPGSQRSAAIALKDN